MNRYKLKAAPFGAEPDADFFFLCERHAEARRHIDQVLWYDEMFVAVLGEQGIGKTMLLKHLLDDVAGEVPLIFLDAAFIRPEDLLRGLLAVLGFEQIDTTLEEYRNILGAYLAHQQRQGSRPVLVLDNVEALPIAVLQEIHWLASIGAEQGGALHFLLFGQPEFLQRLLADPLRDLGDLIRLRHHMRGLSEGETFAYINHRLDLVGGEHRDLIPEAVLPTIYRYSKGVPGIVNRICTAALERAAADSLESVDVTVVSKAIEGLGLAPLIGANVDSAGDSVSAFRRGNVGKFVITFGGRLSGTVPLDQERIVIGRHTLNNICIDSSAVSRCHAQVVVVDGVYVLMDLNSTNGTFVNFKRVQQHVLRDNDIVAIGKHRLKFVAGVSERRPVTGKEAVPVAAQTMVLDGKGIAASRPAMKRVK